MKNFRNIEHKFLFFRIQSRFLTTNGDQDSMDAFARQIQQYITQNGTQDFDARIRRVLEEGPKEPLKIAVTGASGIGKSTFINTMRGLKPNDPRAAKTSSTQQCTITTQEYPDPKNPKLIYYDLPGIGTSNFPKDEYIKKLSLNNYDCFIIMSGNRFTENDCYLATEIDKLGKKFYFARTRIDESITSALEESEGPFDESAYVNALVEDANDMKKEIIVRTITANSQEVIDRKAALLEERIYLIALLGAGVAVIPIPCLSILCDVPLITKEVHRYMKDFGLDPDSIKNLAERLHMNHTELKQNIFGTSDDANSDSTNAIRSAVTAALAKTLATTAIAQSTYIAPIFGQVIGSATAFITIKSTLQLLLKEFTELARKRLDQLICAE